jgi:hypothetical protein
LSIITTLPSTSFVFCSNPSNIKKCLGDAPTGYVNKGAATYLGKKEIKWTYDSTWNGTKYKACAWKCRDNTQTESYVKVGNACVLDSVHQQ